MQFMQVLYPYVGDIGFGKLTDATSINTDAWDGYPATRKTIQDAIVAHRNDFDAVFLTGDIHSSWGAELPVFGAPPVAAGYTSTAVELVCTSVTSDGFGEVLPAALLPVGLAFVKQQNPHLKYLEATKHGCCIVDVTAARVQCDWYYTTSTAADVRTDDAATMQPGASWHTRAGTKTLEPVGADGAPAPVPDDCTPEIEPPTTTATPRSASGATGGAPDDHTSASTIPVAVPLGGAAAVLAGAGAAAFARRRRSTDVPD